MNLIKVSLNTTKHSLPLINVNKKTLVLRINFSIRFNISMVPKGLL